MNEIHEIHQSESLKFVTLERQNFQQQKPTKNEHTTCTPPCSSERPLPTNALCNSHFKHENAGRRAQCGACQGHWSCFRARRAEHFRAISHVSTVAPTAPQTRLHVPGLHGSIQLRSQRMHGRLRKMHGHVPKFCTVVALSRRC